MRPGHDLAQPQTVAEAEMLDRQARTGDPYHCQPTFFGGCWLDMQDLYTFILRSIFDYGSLMVQVKAAGDGSVWWTGTGQNFPNSRAFAVTTDDGNLVTWGVPEAGGFSNHLQFFPYPSDPAAITRIVTSDRAFVALREDGSATIWGYINAGGYDTPVSEQME